MMRCTIEKLELLREGGYIQSEGPGCEIKGRPRGPVALWYILPLAQHGP